MVSARVSGRVRVSGKLRVRVSGRVRVRQLYGRELLGNTLLERRRQEPWVMVRDMVSAGISGRVRVSGKFRVSARVRVRVSFSKLHVYKFLRNLLLTRLREECWIRARIRAMVRVRGRVRARARVRVRKPGTR